MVPDGFPPASTVYRWFVRLRDDGVFKTMSGDDIEDDEAAQIAAE